MASATAPTVDANGISAPTFADILAYLQTQYRAIYGADLYLGNDSQDGQFLGIVAAAINDSNAAAVAVYNSFSPATAQGNGLSNNVKINGISRLVASNSSADVILVGVAGTVITNGVVSDANNNYWNLPASVVIPSSGTITVTATAQQSGAITAAANTINKIQTAAYGWQSVTNPLAATAGNPIETDAALRVRQNNSVALPSQTVLSGILGGVQSITGVTAAAIYENDTNTTDGNGLPAHSFAVVAQGGDPIAIATEILNKKSIGAYTYGTTVNTIVDSDGVSNTIRFFRPTVSNVKVAVTLHALIGYTSLIGSAIQTAVANYINALKIGDDVMITRLYLPAQLNGNADSLTFEIVGVQAALVGGTLGSTDIAIPFNGLGQCTAANVTVTVV